MERVVQQPTQPQLLVLTSTFPRWQDDHEPAFVYELSRRLTARFAVTVVAPRYPGAFKQEVMDGMVVLRYGYFFRRWEKLATSGGGILGRLKANPLYVLLLPSFLLSQLFFVRRLLKREKFSAIHAHWLLPQGLIAILACTMASQTRRIVVTSHGADVFALSLAVFRWLRRLVVERSDSTTVVSRALHDRLRADSGEQPGQPLIIPMGVDLSHRFVPAPGIDRGNGELLFVGRIVEKKGLDVLIRAMPSILAEYPNVTLTIAGSGPCEAAIKVLMEQRGVATQCRLLGTVGQHELPAFYQRATMLVAPFCVAAGGDQEGLGLVLVEAAGCECPVVAGDVPAVRDVVEHERTGILVAPGNEYALAQAVIGLLRAPSRRIVLASAARTHCLAHFDWEDIGQRYAELLSISDG
jgi:glycosyltransferase involved in cell wall biosynthesis